MGGYVGTSALTPPDRVPEHYRTFTAALSAIAAEPSLRAGAAAISEPVLLHHHRRVESFYCYPRNYWWFYRPYTTGLDGHARCMPYFNYLGPYEGRARPDRYAK